MIDGTVAVVGASGFVGSVFVERLMQERSVRVVPLIHSSGNAAGIARHGLEMRMVDLLSPTSVAAALRGCTHVVNCARGNTMVLTRGFQNLVDACVTARMVRLVHISSVAVYGDEVAGEISEGREPRPTSGYATSKLGQDRAVRAAVKRGLPAVTVCPPNISGSGSPFLLEIVHALRTRQFGLVDGGSGPCQLVDVQNLVHALWLALGPEVPADGARLFVTDCSGATWLDVVDRLAALAETGPARQIEHAEALRLVTTPPAPKASLGRAAKHLLSPEVREALRGDPLFARGDELLRTWLRTAPDRVQRVRHSFRRSGEAARRAHAPGGTPSISTALVGVQLRHVCYSCARARSVLGYSPAVTFDQSMNGFRRWYTDAFGWSTGWWPLLRQLSS